jgi:hypothetical protein
VFISDRISYLHPGGFPDREESYSARLDPNVPITVELGDMDRVDYENEYDIDCHLPIYLVSQFSSDFSVIFFFKRIQHGFLEVV